MWEDFSMKGKHGVTTAYKQKAHNFSVYYTIASAALKKLKICNNFQCNVVTLEKKMQKFRKKFATLNNLKQSPLLTTFTIYHRAQKPALQNCSKFAFCCRGMQVCIHCIVTK